MSGSYPIVLLLIGLIWIGATAADTGGAALIAAAKRGDLVAVAALLDEGADPDAHDAADNTALIFAARDGHGEIARVLIDRGATVNWIVGEGVTPLIRASFKGRAGIVRLLLARGADPEIRDRWGRRALDYALRRGEDDAIAKLLVNR